MIEMQFLLEFRISKETGERLPGGNRENRKNQREPRGNQEETKREPIGSQERARREPERTNKKQEAMRL